MAIAEKAEKKQEKPKKERTGRVDQIIGPVVDVVFEAEDLPEIYHALEIDRGKQGRFSNLGFQAIPENHNLR